MKQFILLLLATVLALTLVSCAQNPDSASSFSGSPDGSNGKNFITFLLRLNDGGRISPGGYYVILLNSNVQAIEVTTPAPTLMQSGSPLMGTWWQATSGFTVFRACPGPGMISYPPPVLMNIPRYHLITAPWPILFKLNDSSVIFNQYISNRFTATAITTDTYQNALLGRTLDCMGPGPDISQNDEYTTFFDKTTGLMDPKPPNYPQDALYDWTPKGDLPSDFPYINFDMRVSRSTSNRGATCNAGHDSFLGIGTYGDRFMGKGLQGELEPEFLLFTAVDEPGQEVMTFLGDAESWYVYFLFIMS